MIFPQGNSCTILRVSNARQQVVGEGQKTGRQRRCLLLIIQEAFSRSNNLYASRNYRHGELSANDWGGVDYGGRGYILYTTIRWSSEGRVEIEIPSTARAERAERRTGRSTSSSATPRQDGIGNRKQLIIRHPA